jgi:hypothetical protein
MSIARTVDLSSRPSSSSGTAERSGTTLRAVLLAAAAALALALLGGAYAYFGTGAGDGYPDTTQQWTD